MSACVCVDAVLGSGSGVVNQVDAKDDSDAEVVSVPSSYF